MPRFFIHIENGNGVQRDEVGSDFSTARSAVAETARMAGELLREEVDDRMTDRHMVFRVEDELRQSVATIRLELSYDR